MTAGEGIASSSGPDEVMPPGEEEGRGRPRGGRAEGGAQNPGGGFEGQRGRKVGSVGGEGGGAGALGWGPDRKEVREGEEAKAGEEDRQGPQGPQRAFFIFPYSAS